MPTRPKKPTISTKVKALIGGIGLAVVTAIIIALVMDWFSITEPKLVHGGGIPHIPMIMEVKEENGKFALYIETEVSFRNLGFRSGYIADIKIVPEGPKPYPQEVRILEWDKTYIPFMRKHAVHCRFVAIISPDITYPVPLTFKANFYGQMGNQIHWEGIHIYYNDQPIKQ